MNYRLVLLRILLPLTRLIARLHFPFTRKRVTGLHYYSVLPYLKPGAVLLTYTRGELSAPFIPGTFKHAAIYIGNEVFEDDNDKISYRPYVIEAIGKGVVKTDLISFLTSKDRVIVLYPTFCSDGDMAGAAYSAKQHLHVPYDYFFTPGSTAFYCSELIQHCYYLWDAAFEKRKRLGVVTVTPNDFFMATFSERPKWKIAWDSSGQV